MYTSLGSLADLIAGMIVPFWCGSRAIRLRR